MSELALRLAGDVTVRGTITFDGEQAFSVHHDGILKVTGGDFKQ
jgi:hypothetical protein